MKPPRPIPGLECERRFPLFGSEARLLVGDPADENATWPEVAAVQIEFFLRGLHKGLTRFEPDSELSLLNDADADIVHVSTTLAIAVDAALWATERSDGLVDPTLVGELEQAGYASSRTGEQAASITEALATAPPRSPAEPAPAARWREISVDAVAGTVTRPPGLRIETGGSTKGLAADLAAERLGGHASFVVDLGGDLRMGGRRPPRRLVRIDHPLRHESAHEFELAGGAVATSGIRTRLWRQPGGHGHHLIDPSTGGPAWTGVIQASALGETALEAETLAKMAFLRGPDGAGEVLAEHGGVIVLDDGSVELHGALRPRVTRQAVAA